jgi:hypothetical protein
MGDEKTPTWSQVKVKLAALDKDDLLKLIRDLYRLNADNRIYLLTNLEMQISSALVERYRRAIRREFNPDRGFPRLDIGNARKQLDEFKKACADLRSVVDLVVYYIEQGVACTNQYGDIDAPFYNSLESAFSEAITMIRESGNQALIEEFHPRLESIVYETSGMGWGFHDYLSDVFDNEYPEC